MKPISHQQESYNGFIYTLRPVKIRNVKRLQKSKSRGSYKFNKVFRGSGGVAYKTQYIEIFNIINFTFFERQ